MNPFTPFPIDASDGPPEPGNKVRSTLKPKWTVYAAKVADHPGEWFVITTPAATWAQRGATALRNNGCEAVTRGPSIYVRWPSIGDGE